MNVNSRKDHINKNAMTDEAQIAGPSIPGRTHLLKKKLRLATGTFDDVSDSNRKTFDRFSQQNDLEI